MKYTTPSGQRPIESVRLSLSKQTVQWHSAYDSIAAAVPGSYTVALTLGAQSYRTPVNFDAKGNANALSSVRPSFVLANGRLKVGDPGVDRATLAMLLSDASFIYTNGTPLRIRLLQGTTVLVDRDFTALGVGRQTTNQLGQLVFRVKTLSDSAVANRLTRFSYNSANGTLAIGLSGLSLGALSNSEAQVTAELTVGDKIYSTSVTFFGSNPGTYSTIMR